MNRNKSSANHCLPTTLAELFTEDVKLAYQRVAPMSLKQLLANKPHLNKYAAGEVWQQVAIIPSEHPHKSKVAIVCLSAFQQSFTDAQYVRAKVAQQLVAPRHDMVILPNNSVRNDNYYLPRQYHHLIDNGDMSVVARGLVDILKQVIHDNGYDGILINGYSFGARLALEVACAGATILPIVAINIDEMPSRDGRGVERLKKDFIDSGGYATHKRAIKESGIEAFEQAYVLPRLAWDYGKFLLASYCNRQNVVLARGILGSAANKLIGLSQLPPDVAIKIGYVQKSKMFHCDAQTRHNIAELKNAGNNIRLVKYSGKGTYAHATCDNPLTYALMLKDAFGGYLVS